MVYFMDNKLFGMYLNHYYYFLQLQNVKTDGEVYVTHSGNIKETKNYLLVPLEPKNLGNGILKDI